MDMASGEYVINHAVHCKPQSVSMASGQMIMSCLHNHLKYNRKANPVKHTICLSVIYDGVVGACFHYQLAI